MIDDLRNQPCYWPRHDRYFSPLPSLLSKRLRDNSIIICVTRVISHVLQTVKMLEKRYTVCTDGLTSCQVGFYYCPESRGHIWCKQYFLYIIGKLVFATRGDICCSIEFNSIRCLQSLLLNSVCITISLGPNFVTRARDSSNLLPAKVADRFWMLSAKWINLSANTTNILKHPNVLPAKVADVFFISSAKAEIRPHLAERRTLCHALFVTLPLHCTLYKVRVLILDCKGGYRESKD